MQKNIIGHSSGTFCDMGTSWMREGSLKTNQAPNYVLINLRLTATLAAAAAAVAVSAQVTGMYPASPDQVTNLTTHSQSFSGRTEASRATYVVTPTETPAGSLRYGVPSREAADMPLLYGYVVAGSNKGWCTFTSASDIKVISKGTKGVNAQYGGAWIGDLFYAISGTNYIDKFKTSNWARQTHTRISNVGLKANDVAFDPTAQMAYGCFYSDTGDSWVFGRIDYVKRVRTVIRPLSVGWNAVMVAPDGQVYAIDMNGDLLKVDKTTGEYTVVGNTGVVPVYQTSGTIDPASGRCFWCVKPADGSSFLYEVDLASGRGTKLFQFPNDEEVTSLMTAPVPPAAAAPGLATWLEALFEKGSMTGSFTATLPATLADGTDASGSVNYTVWDNGTKVAEGSGAYGSTVTVDVTAVDEGVNYLVIAADNDAGTGGHAYVTPFVGNDTPKAPVPVMTYEDGAFHISWTAVTEGVNKGYLDADAVTYTVVRNPGNVEVAVGIKDNHFEDPVAVTPNRVVAYRYSVNAEARGKVGAAGVTQAYPLGVINPPFVEGFDSEASLDKFIILDGNNDGVTWKFSTGLSSAYITNSSASNHDDWLITAAINLKQGRKYKLNFETMSSFDGCVERLEVKMGREATAAAMTTTLVEPMDIDTNTALIPISREIEVEESGLYYIGFHAISDPNQFYLYVDNISIITESGPELDAQDPPYVQTFDESDCLSDFYIVDGNGDGRIWNINGGEARAPYGAGMAMDEWLVSPPLNLVSGRQYYVSLKAHASTLEIPEKLEVKFGDDYLPSAMTEEIIPVTEVTSQEPNELGAFIRVATDGVYFIGIHGCSDAGSYELYVDDLKVDAPVLDGAPAAATDIKLTPGAYGELTATVAFKAPAYTVDGSALESIDNIEVYRGETLLANFINPRPGAYLQAQDATEMPREDTYRYTVVAYNEAGAGVPAKAEIFVGTDVPSYPTDVVAAEIDNSGRVTISWTAPATDVKGVPMNAGQLTYVLMDIVDGRQLVIAQDITDTSYTVQAGGSDQKQQFKVYGVFAKSSAGIGRGTPSNTVVVGEPLVLPFEESFSNGALSTPLAVEMVAPTAQWSMYNDGTIGLAAADGDNGFTAMQSANSGGAAAMLFAKLNLPEPDENEVLKMSFYVYNIEHPEYADDNHILVQYKRPSDTSYTNVDDITMCDTGGYGWQKVELDISDISGQTVLFRIVGVAVGFEYTMFDAMKVCLEEVDGIDAVEAGTNGVTITPLAGGVAVSGAMDGTRVSVFGIDGATVFTADARPGMVIPLSPGVYIVKASGKVEKVLVR